MTRRLKVLVGILAVSSTLTGTYWLWPGPSMSLSAALRRGVGRLTVIRVEPVRDESVRAFVQSLAPLVPCELRLSSDGSVDERRLLSWEGDVYDADVLLDRLEELTPTGEHTIGITDQPMHDEGHWWLYGKARLSGRTSLVSTAHLWVDDHEGDTQRWLFRERLGKVGVHEFGHSVGFVHCEHPRCVMRFATQLWMLDETRPSFCRGCVATWMGWHADPNEPTIEPERAADGQTPSHGRPRRDGLPDDR